jgi:phage pi2 protein 07
MINAQTHIFVRTCTKKQWISTSDKEVWHAQDLKHGKENKSKETVQQQQQKKQHSP